MKCSFDVYCRVIDNHGDAGVCWRLSQLLHHEFQCSVRLIIDHLQVLNDILPECQLNQPFQSIQGVEVIEWSYHQDHAQTSADVIVEGFACDIPDNVINAMSSDGRKHLWINLEYLTAEKWGETVHAKPSMTGHGIQKYFFVPGFTSNTAGLIREKNLSRPTKKQIKINGCNEHHILLYQYSNTAIPQLLQWLSDRNSKTKLHIFPGDGQKIAFKWFQQRDCQSKITSNNDHSLAMEVLPFVAQTHFDDYLIESHLAFVRGEDSFVRAQCLGKAFVWMAYPQEEDAHMAKLDAFLELYTAEMDASLTLIYSEVTRGWNQQIFDPYLWDQLWENMEALNQHARQWRDYLQKQIPLTEAMVKFSEVLLS